MKTLTSVLLSAVVLTVVPVAPADELPEKYRPAVAKGLAWLVKEQHKDGRWTAANDQYPTAMTALAGMALLAEGSTPKKGKHAESIRKAIDWLLKQSRTGAVNDGLICPSDANSETGRYTFGHGYATAFLSQALDDMDADRKRRAKDVLSRAVRFTAAAQTPKGGWGYISAQEGGNFDEGACTIATIQGLHAARAAGIPVPREVLSKAHTYMKQSTGPQGGIYYSLNTANTERPALTAGALAVSGVGDTAAAEFTKWHKYCQERIPVGAGGRLGYDEYTYYHHAQAVYALGDKGWAKLFPQSREADRLTWSRYRESLFDQLTRTQQADGSWANTSVGPVYTTAVYLTVLQLDRGHVPVVRP
jgi:hypothetical protein